MFCVMTDDNHQLLLIEALLIRSLLTTLSGYIHLPTLPYICIIKSYVRNVLASFNALQFIDSLHMSLAITALLILNYTIWYNHKYNVLYYFHGSDDSSVSWPPPCNWTSQLLLSCSLDYLI